MPTETKNSTAKASRSGSDSVGGPLAQRRFAQDHAGEEGAERERHAEQLRRRRRRRRARSTARRAGTARAIRYGRRSAAASGITRLPTTSMNATKAADLAERQRRRVASSASRAGAVGACPCRDARRAPAAAPAPAPSRGPRRSASRRRCGRARSRAAAAPAARAAAPRCSRPTARGRTRGRRRRSSPHSRASPCRAASRPAICASAPGNRDGADRQQILEREMQADPEHQQDDADLGELQRRAFWSATKPGVNGPTAMPASR